MDQIGRIQPSLHNEDQSQRILTCITIHIPFFAYITQNHGRRSPRSDWARQRRTHVQRQLVGYSWICWKCVHTCVLYVHCLKCMNVHGFVQMVAEIQPAKTNTVKQSNVNAKFLMMRLSTSHKQRHWHEDSPKLKKFLTNGVYEMQSILRLVSIWSALTYSVDVCHFWNRIVGKEVTSIIEHCSPPQLYWGFYPVFRESALQVALEEAEKRLAKSQDPKSKYERMDPRWRVPQRAKLFNLNLRPTSILIVLGLVLWKSLQVDFVRSFDNLSVCFIFTVQLKNRFHILDISVAQHPSLVQRIELFIQYVDSSPSQTGAPWGKISDAHCRQYAQ